MMKKRVVGAVTAMAISSLYSHASGLDEANPSESSFWGKLGFAYQFQDENRKSDADFSDKENNAFSSSVVLGVSKDIGYGFAITAEVAGWSDLGLDIADKGRVDSSDSTSAEISEGYLSYKSANTSIKAGRQALSPDISPWAWTDTTAGVKDWTYDGISIVNSTLENTDIVAAWVVQGSRDSSQLQKVADNSGMFLLTVLNRSIENTTITLNANYIPDSEMNILTGMTTMKADTWSLWATVVGAQGDIGWGVETAYVDGDVKGWDSTYGIVAKLSGKWESLFVELRAGYINDGDYRLAMAGAGTGVEDSSFWTDTYDISGDTYGAEQLSIQARVKYAVGEGSLYGLLGYWDFDEHPKWGDEKSAWNMQAGYKFRIYDIDAKLEYRYRDFDYYSSDSRSRQRIRIEAYYKF
jgi:opacity protein-like surface antigen